VFPPFPTPAQRLAAKLVRTPNGCVEWRGLANVNGYGIICVNGKRVLTHRFAWTLANGPIPDGLEVCHHCDNPPCCNARGCLFLGTHAENMADRKAKGKGRGWKKEITHCPFDHPYSGLNLYVDPSGKRHCRACRRRGDHARTATKIPCDICGVVIGVGVMRRHQLRRHAVLAVAS